MFLTITANAALDRVFFIEEFKPGGIMRSEKVVDSVGGKGLDTSVALRSLGQETLGLGFIAGPTGERLVQLLDSYGIAHDLVSVGGDTRIANVICERRLHRHSHLMEGGYSISSRDYDAFLRIYAKWLSQAQWVIAAGSIPDGLPKDFYRTIIEMANQAEVPALLDCAGDLALEAISAHPRVLKMNQAEFRRTFGQRGDDFGQLFADALDLYKERGLHALVITCGGDGLVAITPDGCYHAASPRQEVVNAAGAGDATSAGLVWRLSLEDTWPEALRWSAAIGAATVLTERTAECQLRDVGPIYASVRIREIASNP